MSLKTAEFHHIVIVMSISSSCSAKLSMKFFYNLVPGVLLLKVLPLDAK